MDFSQITLILALASQQFLLTCAIAFKYIIVSYIKYSLCLAITAVFQSSAFTARISVSPPSPPTVTPKLSISVRQFGLLPVRSFKYSAYGNSNAPFSIWRTRSQLVISI
jgi:hypothetical protein